MGNVRQMTPEQIAELRKHRSEARGPLPPLRWVDHRALAGMSPPPRVHEEAHATARHRRLFLTSLRRSGAHVTVESDGTIHVE